MAENRKDAAERKRMDQGLHECEVFEDASDVMEGNMSMASCKKNPGHLSFIPYPDFRMEHLPEEWRTQDVFRNVTELSERTVKLRVGYTSMHRPEGYAFSNVRGSTDIHTGSGWIEHAISRTDIPCPCTDCASSDSPHQGDWLEVNVVTACHVVYDADEARSTLVDVYYNTKASRRDGTMKTIRAYDVLKNDEVKDACVLVCAAHDLDNIQLSFPLKISVKPTPALKVTRDDLCLVISHPHGSPKKITVGEVKDADPSMPEALITYNSSTCKGSSGAPVLAFYTEGTRTVYQSTVHSRGGVPGGLNQGSCVYVKLE